MLSRCPEDWDQQLHASKCKAFILAKKKTIQKNNQSYTLGNNQLEVVIEEKDIGIITEYTKCGNL